MDQRPTKSSKPNGLLFGSIASVLFFFFSIPLCIIAYAAAGGLLSGLAIVGLLICLQAPGFMLLKWSGVLGKFSLGKHKDD